MSANLLRFKALPDQRRRLVRASELAQRHNAGCGPEQGAVDKLRELCARDPGVGKIIDDLLDARDAPAIRLRSKTAKDAPIVRMARRLAELRPHAAAFLERVIEDLIAEATNDDGKAGA
jgi:hypothetical protein